MDGRRGHYSDLYHLPRHAWSRWFAAAPAAASPWSWGGFLLVALPACVLFLGRLHLPLLEPEEARYAEIPRQMLAEGRILEPVWHGEAYYHKPPLFYWLVMLSYRLLGVSDGAARLVPALSALGLVAVLYFWTWRTQGTRVAVTAALILCLSGRFVFLGRMIVLDGLLALWVTAGLACAHLALREGRLRWRWWLGAALACGLGVLTKGPVALVLILVPVFLYAWLVQSAARLSLKSLAAFLGVTALVAGPWFLAVAFHSPEAIATFFLQHNLERFMQPFDHAEPFWFFVPGLIFTLFPASLLLLPLGRLLLSRQARLAEQRTESLGFVLLSFLVGFGFFSLSGCKRPVYLLPCLPCCAVLLASGFAIIAPATRAGTLRWLGLATALFFALFVGVHEWLPDYHRHFGMRGQARRHREADSLPVVCYPHRWDSISFYLQRGDVLAFGPEQRAALLNQLQENEQTLVFVKNEKHLACFRQGLPPTLEFVPTGRAGRNVSVGVVRRVDAVMN